MLKKINLFFLAFLIIFITVPNPVYAENNPPVVYTIEIEGTITAGTAIFIDRAIQAAEGDQVEALLIKINTPGGLVNATLDILQAMTSSTVPTITFVTPKGGIAASAGSFILISGNIAVMSPGTTCGAAMPVTIGTTGESPVAADEKTINFLAGHIRSIASERNRPTDIAEKFVTENLTLSYSEALEIGIIDYLADDTTDLLNIIDNVELILNDEKTIVLNTKDANIISIEQKSEEKLINLLSNPQLAMILLMLGLYGLIIGFNSPGFFLPEVLGGICLILGLFGIGLFEINLAAGLLIFLGLALLIAEAFTPTYGILAVGGVISIVLGILFFPIEPLMPSLWFSSFKAWAIAIGILGAFFISLVLFQILRLKKMITVHGEQELSGKAVVVSTIDPIGMIKIQGEIWKAKSKNNDTIFEGEEVKVLKRTGVEVLVERIAKQSST